MSNARVGIQAQQAPKSVAVVVNRAAVCVSFRAIAWGTRARVVFKGWTLRVKGVAGTYSWFQAPITVYPR